MIPLALVGDDIVPLVGLAVSFIISLILIGIARRYAAKFGFVVSGILLCLGIDYFGWRPLLGIFNPESAFGCICLLLGLLSIFILRLLDALPPPPPRTPAPAPQPNPDRR